MDESISRLIGEKLDLEKKCSELCKKEKKLREKVNKLSQEDRRIYDRLIHCKRF